MLTIVFFDEMLLNYKTKEDASFKVKLKSFLQKRIQG